jgi:hypothetical protein
MATIKDGENVDLAPDISKTVCEPSPIYAHLVLPLFSNAKQAEFDASTAMRA